MNATIDGSSFALADDVGCCMAVVFGGIAMHAAVVDDESERNRLWHLADRVFPAFVSYRRDAARVNRKIPIVQLTPR